MIRAVVFDFDGVLANSEPLHFRAFSEVLAEQGLTLTEGAYYSQYLGYDDVGAFRAIAADLGITMDEMQIADLTAQKAIRLEALEHGASVLFPGARDAVLRMAREGPIAIASGAIRPEIVRVLEREGLSSLFAVLVAAGDTAASKPDPAPYAKAVELLAATSRRLQPDECVAVEDSRWGLQSAKSAGLHTVAVTHSYPAGDLQDAADTVISHLDELTPQLLARLSR